MFAFCRRYYQKRSSSKTSDIEFMKVVADESIDYGIIMRLRAEGFTVHAIIDEHSGISDTDVLDIATKNECLLLTEDKDFGELSYRLKRKHCGILLIRVNDLPRNERISLVCRIVASKFHKLSNNFSVLTSSNIRIKQSK